MPQSGLAACEKKLRAHSHAILARKVDAMSKWNKRSNDGVLWGCVVHGGEVDGCSSDAQMAESRECLADDRHDVPIDTARSDPALHLQPRKVLSTFEPAGAHTN